MPNNEILHCQRILMEIDSFFDDRFFEKENNNCNYFRFVLGFLEEFIGGENSIF